MGYSQKSNVRGQLYEGAEGQIRIVSELFERINDGGLSIEQLEQLKGDISRQPSFLGELKGEKGRSSSR